MHFLMTQFLQRKELRLQHFTIQRRRLTSILPIVCGVFGKEAMLFAKWSFTVANVGLHGEEEESSGKKSLPVLASTGRKGQDTRSQLLK